MNHNSVFHSGKYGEVIFTSSRQMDGVNLAARSISKVNERKSGTMRAF
jgi:hypothetical protein